MEKQRIRELTLQVLAKNPQTHVHMIENEIRQLAGDYERHDTLALQEVVWDLLVQGILAPGKNSLNLNLPFVHVTEYGARCLDDGAIRAHDPRNYIEHLIALATERVGPLVVDSAREAQLSFLAGRYPSAVVMLARAVEGLLDAMVDALTRSGAEIALSWTDAKAQLLAIIAALETQLLPAPLQDEQGPRLAGLRTLLDLSRTDDGRPLVASVDRDQVLAYLLLFPAQCRFVYDLISHLEGESPE